MSKSIRRLVIVLVLATWVIGMPCAQATPAHKAAFERHFDRFLTRNLASCSTCHLPSDKKDPESLDDFPHNPFGDALHKAGEQLKRGGKKRDISSRLALIASQDSDGDGVDNLTELLLGHNPGDAKDTPTSAELQQAPTRRAEFAEYLKLYRWTPYEAVTRPAVPQVGTASFLVRNSIDAFVLEQLQPNGLKPSPEAAKVTLLRRVYLDLIGLNPTPAEITAFEKDVSPSAYEIVVDRLLADPRYGQRWARHWMDVWRYSDWAGWTGGNQIRDSQPFIWRWRDWIVESLNADKGYDRMVLEMLAADELAPDDDANLRATGFLVRNYKMGSREQWMEDTVNHTSRAFIGMTMHCAKCHDHKFDPVTQEDYYRLRAVFEPYEVRTDPIPGMSDKKKDGLVRAYDKELTAQTLFYIRGDERTPDQKKGALSPGIPAALGGSLDINPIALSESVAHPDRRDYVRKALLAESRKMLEETRAKFDPVKDNEKTPSRQRSEAQASLAAVRAKHESLVALFHVEEIEDAGHKKTAEWESAAREALAAQRRTPVADATQSLISAQNAAYEIRQKLAPTTQPVSKTVADKATADLKALDAKIESSQKLLATAVTDLNAPPDTAYKPRSTDDYPATSTGRRLALARWLIDNRNPLTARVAVNHLWARHFGQGIVPSVDDFGRNGRPATHPALLDWLAAELVENHWKMKPIHRLIVTSATYRQSSIAQPDGLSRDPDDIWLWRFPSRRMEAELVRDNVLYCAGKLDLAMGGPDVDHSQGLISKRRSLYLQCAPEKEVEFLQLFDGPNTNECYFRRPSVVPQQALALANSQLVIEQSRALAKELSRDNDSPQAFIKAAFLRILARPATADEVEACGKFLIAPELKPDRARENLIVVLFNHHDFVTIR